MLYKNKNKKMYNTQLVAYTPLKIDDIILGVVTIFAYDKILLKCLDISSALLCVKHRDNFN